MSRKHLVIVILLSTAVLVFGFYYFIDDEVNSSQSIPDRNIQAFAPNEPIFRVDFRGLSQLGESLRKLEFWDRFEKSRYYEFVRHRLIPLLQLQFSGLSANQPIPAEQLIRTVGSKGTFIKERPGRKNMGVIIVELNQGEDSLTPKRFDELLRGRVIDTARRVEGWTVRSESFRGWKLFTLGFSPADMNFKLEIRLMRFGNYFLAGFGESRLKKMLRRYLGSKPSKSRLVGNQPTGKDTFTIAYEGNLSSSKIRSSFTNLTGSMTPALLINIGHSPKNLSLSGSININNGMLHASGRISGIRADQLRINNKHDSFQTTRFVPRESTLYVSWNSPYGREFLQSESEPDTGREQEDDIVEMAFALSPNPSGGIYSESFPFDVHYVLHHGHHIPRRLKRKFLSEFGIEDLPETSPTRTTVEVANRKIRLNILRRPRLLVATTSSRWIDTLRDTSPSKESLRTSERFQYLRSSLSDQLDQVMFISSSPLSQFVDASTIEQLKPGLRKIISIFFGFNPYREMNNLLKSSRGNIVGSWWAPQCECLRYSARSSGDFFLPMWGVVRYGLKQPRILKILQNLSARQFLKRQFPSTVSEKN